MERSVHNEIRFVRISCRRALFPILVGGTRSGRFAVGGKETAVTAGLAIGFWPGPSSPCVSYGPAEERPRRPGGASPRHRARECTLGCRAAESGAPGRAQGLCAERQIAWEEARELPERRVRDPFGGCTPPERRAVPATGGGKLELAQQAAKGDLDQERSRSSNSSNRLREQLGRYEEGTAQPRVRAPARLRGSRPTGEAARRIPGQACRSRPETSSPRCVPRPHGDAGASSSCGA